MLPCDEHWPLEWPLNCSLTKSSCDTLKWVAAFWLKQNQITNSDERQIWAQNYLKENKRILVLAAHDKTVEKPKRKPAVRYYSFAILVEVIPISILKYS